MAQATVNPFPNDLWFLRVGSASLLKTLWEKEKLLVTSNFSFSHSVFYLFGELSAIFFKYEIVVWKNIVWKGLKFIIWERAKDHIGSTMFLKLNETIGLDMTFTFDVCEKSSQWVGKSCVSTGVKLLGYK